MPFRAPPVATSAADGTFTLPGRHAPGHSMQYLYAVAPSGVGWCTLQVSHREGAAAPHDIVLREPALLEVEVVDAGGTPLPWVSVTAIPGFQPLGMAPIRGVHPSFENPPAPFVAHTDGEGRAAFFSALPIGEDGLQHGHPVSGGSYVLHVYAPLHRHTWKPVTLVPGVLARQRIVLVDRTVGLRVHGDVRDTAGLPVAGATVTLEGIENGVMRTAADGTFACDDVQANYNVAQILVRAPGHAMLRREMEIGAGPELELHFEVARALPIHGRVVDQDGRPVAHAPVYLNGDVANLDDHLLADADGRFAFDHAPPGQHPLLVIACPEERVFDPVQVVVDNTTEPQEIEVRMRRVTTPLATVELTIVESAGGRPLEPSMAGLAPIDEQGNFRGVIVPLSPFTGGARASDVPPGRYQLRVQTNDGHRCTRRSRCPRAFPWCASTSRSTRRRRSR